MALCLVGRGRKKFILSLSSCRRLHSSSDGSDRVVRIGNVSKVVSAPSRPELVPHSYLPESPLPRSSLAHLKWLLQKDLLGQDVFLLGRPGPQRRQLAQQFLQLTSREMEFVSLSRDTTESDLKQRREIRAGTAEYEDGSAVRAATQGRVLVLEGIEKVERNVLPVLNNLLENREMQLEDGRLLIPGHRYDGLLARHGQAALDSWRLVRVSPEFRVIALGLPVPRYPGSPLDPPLRSRFQARDVASPPYQELLDQLATIAPQLERAQLARILSFSCALLTEESAGLGLPDFPLAALPRALQLLQAVPELQPADLLAKIYPYKLMLPQDGIRAVEDTLATFQLAAGGSGQQLAVAGVESGAEPGLLRVKVGLGRAVREVEVSGGAVSAVNSNSGPWLSTAHHASLLAHLLLAASVDQTVCLVGPRGCGKSALVGQLAARLGLHQETVQLYEDMTARDLLQQRTTTQTGDTIWRLSPLVTAALEGRLAVLDGLHRVHRGSLAVLQRLLHDRELQLYDGTRLVDSQKFETMQQEAGLSREELESRGVRPIHPAFRLVALAEPPTVGTAKGQWLTPEVLAMFTFHEMRALEVGEEAAVLEAVVGQQGEVGRAVLGLTHQLRGSEDAVLRSLATNLSTRQLIRVARRLQHHPDTTAYSAINKACLARFLPALARQSLEKVMEQQGIEKSHQPVDPNIRCEVENNLLTIGTTTAVVSEPDTRGKVPETLFYETPQNLQLLEAMLQDFLLGEAILLVGNQGTGKNKLVDRMLQLLNRPREYIQVLTELLDHRLLFQSLMSVCTNSVNIHCCQLNRDTTVQTLTLQPSVRGGVIVYEDSPLVQVNICCELRYSQLFLAVGRPDWVRAGGGRSGQGSHQRDLRAEEPGRERSDVALGRTADRPGRQLRDRAQRHPSPSRLQDDRPCKPARFSFSRQRFLRNSWRPVRLPRGGQPQPGVGAVHAAPVRAHSPGGQSG